HVGRFDQQGAWAASGRVDTALLERLLQEPFFQQPPPRSTGRELFHLDWLQRHLTGHEAPCDIPATLAELTVACIAHGIAHLPRGDQKTTLLVC
ncbi:anhydro-N-acetylmuramic acid kinase, partial [Hydrogenovibrio sp. 3SP14C1]|uniref:anhydro-N-acetylmuramic acid kinase n=1 Tax=Hydrogenovibrio sp. 3SP14C1 TaxID=3038774 RepID=UPI002416CE3D